MSLKRALNTYLEKNLKKVLLAFFVGNLFISLNLFTENNPVIKERPKLFHEKSTRVLIPLILAFPQALKKGPFPIFILDKNKTIILKKAFLIPKLKQKSDPFFSKGPVPKLVEIPLSKLSKLLPHIGQNLWAFPQIEESEIYEIDF